MTGNSFGDLFRITTFGESHGVALGTVIDGCPSGLVLSVEDFAKELERRRPGQSALTTARSEPDVPEIISGVFEGKTTGMPITVLVRNQAQRSKDYDKLRDQHRPGHADGTYAAKYAHRDHRGGGRSSGRETLSRVIGGVVAKRILPASVQVLGHCLQVGPHRAKQFVPDSIEQNPVRCADPEVAEAMASYILDLKENHDSTGGLVEIRVQGMPPHLGEPVFDKLKAKLAQAIMSVGSVTGFAYGAGFDVVQMRGSEYTADPANFGGITGGISSGEDLRLLVSIKPTSTIGESARTGRHDPCVVPRVIPVLEAMVTLVLADAYLKDGAISARTRET